MWLRTGKQPLFQEKTAVFCAAANVTIYRKLLVKVYFCGEFCLLIH